MLRLRIVVRWVFGWWRNLYGSLSGYGHCAHCKCTWNWVHTFSILYSEDHGMFPVCDLCFRGLDSLRVTQYAFKLVDAWTHRTEDCNGIPFSEVRRNVAQAVRFLKHEIDRPPFRAYWHIADQERHI